MPAMTKQAKRLCGAISDWLSEPCKAHCVSDLDRCVAHAGAALRELGGAAAVAMRPGQVIAWPGFAVDGAQTVWAVVPHTQGKGQTNTGKIKQEWGAVVEAPGDWLARYLANRQAFLFGIAGLGLGIDSLDPLDRLYARAVEGVDPVTFWLSANAEPSWVGRQLRSRSPGELDPATGQPRERVEAVGPIVGRARRLTVSRGRNKPWASVFELAIDEALVLGDRLQASGRTAEGLMLAHAAAREPLDRPLRAQLGLPRNWLTVVEPSV